MVLRVYDYKTFEHECCTHTQKHPIRMSYPINIAFWLDDFGAWVGTSYSKVLLPHAFYIPHKCFNHLFWRRYSRKTRDLEIRHIVIFSTRHKPSERGVDLLYVWRESSTQYALLREWRKWVISVWGMKNALCTSWL
jgi:hypothetical protein